MSDSIFYLQHIEDCRDRSTIALQFTFNPVVLKSVKANYLKQLLDDDLTRHFTLVSEEKGLFSAVNCSTVVFLRILSCLRGRNFDIITSNAYLDIYTNCIIKTFYFESSSRPIVQQVNSDQDIGRKTSSNIPNSNANSTVNESSPVPSNHRLPPPPAPPAISNRPPPPDVKSASVTSPISQKESAVDMSENDDVAIPSFVGSDKNENISMTPPIARSFGKIQGNSTNERNEEYFKRMKESQLAEKQKEMEDLNKLNPNERLKKIQDEKEAQEHESNKTAHYAKLGGAFVNRGAPILSPGGGRGGGRGRGKL